MSGAIILRMSGPISWKVERQQRTSLSSCEAEINATNMGSKLTVAARDFTRDFEACGVPVPSNISGPTKVFNDNNACVLWFHNMTLKATHHIELRENSVREWVQDKSLKVLHVAGKDNVSDIFTKEMRDVAHFCRLCDAFMCQLADSVYCSECVLGFYITTSLHLLSTQRGQTLIKSFSSHRMVRWG